MGMNNKRYRRSRTKHKLEVSQYDINSTIWKNMITALVPDARYRYRHHDQFHTAINQELAKFSGFRTRLGRYFYFKSNEELVRFKLSWG